jgi:hypothetical protein
MSTDGVFAKFADDAWPYWYAGELKVGILAGGIPQDPNVVESWIKTKLRDIRSDAEIQEVIATTMAELGLSEEEAVRKASTQMVGMNGFKRDETGLYVEGRQLKAALKEAVMVAANAGKLETGKWGRPDNASYKKQIKGWFPEHVFIVEERLYICHDGKPVQIHDGVTQKFVHTHRGDSISYEQFVKDAEIRFTVKSDYEMSEKQWALIWLTGQMQGFGASRSQEYGRYTVTRWEPTDAREGGFHPGAPED